MEFRSKLLNKIQVQASKDENKELIEVILTLISVIVLTLVFLIPSYRRVRDLHTDNIKVSAREQSLKEVLENYRTASNYYNQISHIEEDVLQVIPIDPDPSETLRKINFFAIRNNVFLNNLRLISKQDGEESYEFVLKGDFTDIKDFFNSIREDSRFYKVDSLDLSSLSFNSSDERNLELTIKLTTYYRDGN